MAQVQEAMSAAEDKEQVAAQGQKSTNREHVVRRYVQRLITLYSKEGIAHST